MRRPPQWTDASKYPVTAATNFLAIVLSIAWWLKLDMTPLFSGPEVMQGQLWRLLSCTLLHVNIIHLAFDVAWVWAFGTLIEGVFGSFATLGLFISLGFVSSAFEYAFLDGGVGLSGIAYGLFGFLWVLSRRDARFVDAVDQRTISLFVGWFFLCIVFTVTNILPVGNVAHGTGAAAGALIGIAVARRQLLFASTLSTAVSLMMVSGLLATVGRSHVNFSNSRGENEAWLGYEAMVRGDYASAIRLLETSVKQRPGNADAWFNLAIAYQHRADWSNATAAYEHAHALNPQDQQMADAYNKMKAWSTWAATTQPQLLKPVK